MAIKDSDLSNIMLTRTAFGKFWPPSCKARSETRLHDTTNHSLNSEPTKLLVMLSRSINAKKSVTPQNAETCYHCKRVVRFQDGANSF